MADILNIVYDESDSLLFDEFSINKVEIQTSREFIIQKYQNRKPHLQYWGVNTRKFIVTFFTFTTETIEKINFINSLTGQLSLYWDYQNNPGQCTTVKLIPELPFFYNVGLVAANQEIEITFVEIEAI